MSPFRKFCALLRGLRGNRDGNVLVLVGITVSMLIGVSGFAVDMGQVLLARRALQSATDAAALAAAAQINCCQTSTAVATATQYSAAWASSTAAGTNKNALAGRYVQMVAGYPQLKCFASTGVSCSGPDNANGIIVKQTATVPMAFLGLFGWKNTSITATSMASTTGGGSSYDIEFVLDATASMATADATCGTTRFGCAQAGMRLMMSKLEDDADYVGLITFPPLSSASQMSKVGTCPSANPTTTAYKNWTSLASTPSYQAVPLRTDYQGSANSLDATTDIAIALGGGACGGMKPVGGYGSYFADAITAAQQDLAAHGRTTGSVKKAIIILSDGDAGASATNLAAGKATNQCAQAVTAARAAAAAGIDVITIAYGSPTTGCSSDGGATSACATMQNMASKPLFFYSDAANGCRSTQQSLTNLTQIMGAVAGTIIQKPKLLPNSTT